MKWKIETNSDKSQLKKHKYSNCENQCLLNGNINSDLILDTCIIPSLHTVKLGPVNKLYKELLSKVHLSEFEDKHNIFLDPYHGNTLEGPQINKLFHHLSDLEAEIQEKDDSLLDYVDTLKKIKTVDTLCNDNNLNQHYAQIIEDFSHSWLHLKEVHGTTIPNKVHIIMHHLPVFFEKIGVTLKKFSDQTIESTHQEFSKRMETGNYNVKNYRSTKHGKNYYVGLCTLIVTTMVTIFNA